MITLCILNGPQKGRLFEIPGDRVRLGRSSKNDLTLEDLTISRRHFELQKKGTRFRLKDLKSENGTYLNGRRVEPGAEISVREGDIIVAGMTVMGLGKECLDQVMPCLDCVDSSFNLEEIAGSQVQRRSQTIQKNVELIFKVAEAIALSLHPNEILKKILDFLLEFFNRIDRGVVILVDRENHKVSKVISRIKGNGHENRETYNMDIINRVLKAGKAVMVPNALTKEEEEMPDTIRISRIGSAICLPLVWDEKPRGVIYLDSLDKAYGFRKDDLPLLTDLSKRTAFALENALLCEPLI